MATGSKINVNRNTVTSFYDFDQTDSIDFHFYFVPFLFLCLWNSKEYRDGKFIVSWCILKHYENLVM